MKRYHALESRRWLSFTIHVRNRFDKSEVLSRARAVTIIFELSMELGRDEQLPLLAEPALTPVELVHHHDSSDIRPVFDASGLS